METLFWIIIGLLFGGLGIAVVIKPIIFWELRYGLFSSYDTVPKKYELWMERICGLLIAIIGILSLLKPFNIF